MYNNDTFNVHLNIYYTIEFYTYMQNNINMYNTYVLYKMYFMFKKTGFSQYGKL